jgi:YaaC-like Protein
MLGLDALGYWVCYSSGVMAASKRELSVPLRAGDPLRVGREIVTYGRNILQKKGARFELQHRLFANDPWELIAEAIARAPITRKTTDIAQSFRRQAEDYFRAASTGREMAVRPVLFYYAFLNLSKAYAVARGNTALTGTALHGVSSVSQPKKIPFSLIKFSSKACPLVFQELLKLQEGNRSLIRSPLLLGHLLPQILPGHRLWCYATNRAERFLTIERIDIRHSAQTRRVWLNLYLNKEDMQRINISGRSVLSRADLDNFEIAEGHSHIEWECYQQSKPTPYIADPAEALGKIIRRSRTRIWETVKTASPYRKAYIYCSPSSERLSRMPQLLSIYLLMFFLGSITRYSPGDFEEFLESRYGPLFDTFISESPVQFLYLMASEILEREVSRPAIV